MKGFRSNANYSLQKTPLETGGSDRLRCKVTGGGAHLVTAMDGWNKNNSQLAADANLPSLRRPDTLSHVSRPALGVKTWIAEGKGSSWNAGASAGMGVILRDDAAKERLVARMASEKVPLAREEPHPKDHVPIVVHDVWRPSASS